MHMVFPGIQYSINNKFVKHLLEKIDSVFLRNHSQCRLNCRGKGAFKRSFLRSYQGHTALSQTAQTTMLNLWEGGALTLVSPDQDACGPDCVEQHEGDCRDSGDTMRQAGSCGELHRFGGCDKAHDRCAGGVERQGRTKK